MRRVAVLLAVATACRGKPAPVPATPAPAAVATKPAPRAAPAPKSCGSERGTLRGDQVGALRLGMTPLEAREFCTVIRDTIEEVEGERERFLLVNAGRDTLRALVWPEDKITNIYTTSPRFQTVDSIRVGTSLRRLLAFPDLFGGNGEDAFVVFSNAPSVCGLSFELEFTRRGIEIPDGPRAALLPYADSARVKAIFARGCR